jgi:hypothetical protein
VRIQNIVGSWQRTLTSSLLNEFRFGFNKFAASRYPPTNGVPSMQDLGVRLPIYPTDPSISEIQANGFFNIGDNLFASFPRHGFEINDRVNWAGRTRSVRRDGVQDMNPQRVPRAGRFQFNGSVTVARSPTSCSADQHVRPGHGRVQDYRSTTRRRSSGRLQSGDNLTRTSACATNARHPGTGGGPHHALGVEDYNGNVRSTMFPQAPRGRRSAAMRIRRRSVKASPSTASVRFGFAWDITGDGRTSLRGGGGCSDQRRDGESGNGAVSTPPFSLRLSVTRQGPFSDPYRGGSDFHLITDSKIGDERCFPQPVLDLDRRRRIQGAGDLQLQPHVRARSGDRSDGSSGLRRLSGPQRAPHRELNYADANPRRYDRQHRPASPFAAAGLGNVESRCRTAGNFNSMQLTLSKRFSHGFTITGNYAVESSDFGDQFGPYDVPGSALLWVRCLDHRHRFTTSWVLDLPGANMEGR